MREQHKSGVSTSFVFPDRPGALAHYPHVRRVGDLLFVSGISSRRPEGGHDGVTLAEDGTVTTDIEAQTRAVLDNLRVLVERAGSGLDRLADVTAFLVDMAHYDGYNRVWNETFTQALAPARTTVGVRALPHPHLLIEIKAIAVMAPSDGTHAR